MEIKPTITYADFEKLDMRVGSIVSVEPVQDSKKLLRLMVNFNDFERQVLAGIAKDYPDHTQLVGRQAIFIVNLEPRIIAGTESQAMILVAVESEQAAVLEPARPLASGSTVH
ncbi:MAG: hypothetical protein A2542_00665 [Parcubacteria group bacterium RIFOXYD2_FULL_52_8]|nr:MAG: hypothetical protein A2542_00665 [Parcubacteria group bacterium RIFOXYD2_FULL_52_8]